MKPLNWVELTRQQIKARHGFGWSIQGIEKQNKVLTKIVYRFSTGGRTTVLTDIVTTAFNTASAARQTVDNTLGNMVNSKQIRRPKKGVYALNPKDIQKLSAPDYY